MKINYHYVRVSVNWNHQSISQTIGWTIQKKKDLYSKINCNAAVFACFLLLDHHVPSLAKIEGTNLIPEVLIFSEIWWDNLKILHHIHRKKNFPPAHVSRTWEWKQFYHNLHRKKGCLMCTVKLVLKV